MTYYLPFDPIIRLGQQFGWNPGLGPNPAGGHNGDDWLTPVGTPVRAAGDGVVVFAGEFDSTYEDNWGWNLHYGGKMVVLNMDGDTAPYFEYGHNSQILVKAGDRVRAGQVIAITGNSDGGTNISTGPHCHVGCLPWNYNLGSNTYGRINPRLFMTKHWDGGLVLASTGTITPSTEKAGFLMALTDQQQKDLYHAIVEDQGRQSMAQKFADVLLATTLQMNDGGTPVFKELLAADNDRLAGIKRSTDLLPPLDVDLRGEFDAIRARDAAQTATIAHLAVLASEKQDNVTREDILAQIDQSIANAVVKVSVTVAGGE